MNDATGKKEDMAFGLPIWVVYKSPSDYPGRFVARLWKGVTATDRVIVTESLAEIRIILGRKGFVKLDRQPGDDPVILETWI